MMIKQEPPGNDFLNFSVALDLMRKDLTVARLSWPSGQHVGLNKSLGEFVLYYKEHAVSGWGFSPNDLLANDWLIHACEDGGY